MKTIEHSPVNSDFMEIVMIDKITYLSKKENNEKITLIHLTTGEVLESEDSMRTLEARINSAD